MPQPIIIQGTRKILPSGSILITRESEPVLIVHDGAELEIEFDVDGPVTRADGSIVRRAVGENAASYTGEVKERTFGSAKARYFLTPFPANKVGHVEPLGPRGEHQLSWLLVYEVTEPSASAGLLPTRIPNGCCRCRRAPTPTARSESRYPRT